MNQPTRDPVRFAVRAATDRDPFPGRPAVLVDAPERAFLTVEDAEALKRADPIGIQALLRPDGEYLILGSRGGIGAGRAVYRNIGPMHGIAGWALERIA